MEPSRTSQENTTPHPDTPTYQICAKRKPSYKPVPMHLHLKYALHRMFTFPSDWNFIISKEEVANSGFYLTEGAKSVQCYYCNLEITDRFDWNYMVYSIDTRHHALNPACPFIRGDETTNLPIGDVTNYRYEAHRLHSFLINDWMCPVSPFDLAKYGFYWTGSSDNCLCAFCYLEIRGWETGDSAEDEHRRWNPECIFMNGVIVGNVPIGRENVEDTAGMIAYDSIQFSIMNPFTNSQVSRYYDQITYKNCRKPRPSFEALGVIPISTPKYPEYMSLESRIDSYKMWPANVPEKLDDLAEAGFYYFGVGDRVICFQCGGGLKDWTLRDIPWYEHAKWFSLCPYLLLKKGKVYVDEALQELELETPLNLNYLPTENLKSVQKHIQRETLNLKCRICKKNEIEIVYLPCGHMVSCVSCNDKETACRKCKKTYVAYIKIFL